MIIASYATITIMDKFFNQCSVISFAYSKLPTNTSATYQCLSFIYDNTIFYAPTSLGNKNDVQKKSDHFCVIVVFPMLKIRRQFDIAFHIQKLALSACSSRIAARLHRSLPLEPLYCFYGCNSVALLLLQKY